MTDPETLACAAETNPPWSRSRMLVRTGDLAFVLTTADDARTAHRFDVCELAEWHATAVRCIYEQSPDRGRVAARLRHVAHGDIEPAFPFKNGAHPTATDGQLDHLLDVADIETVARQQAAVDGHPELGLIGFLLDRRVRRTRDRPDHLEHLGGKATQDHEIRTGENHGEIRRGARRDLRRRIDDGLRDVEGRAGNAGVEPF